MAIRIITEGPTGREPLCWVALPGVDPGASSAGTLASAAVYGPDLTFSADLSWPRGRAVTHSKKGGSRLSDAESPGIYGDRQWAGVKPLEPSP